MKSEEGKKLEQIKPPTEAFLLLSSPFSASSRLSLINCKLHRFQLEIPVVVRL
jgi:hypothetical protein